MRAVFAYEQQGVPNVEKSIRLLQESDVVIADLSLERPSCYYEVGFAQAMWKPVAIVAATGTPIHQVKYSEQILYYNNLTQYEALIHQLLAKFKP